MKNGCKQSNQAWNKKRRVGFQEHAPTADSAAAFGKLMNLTAYTANSAVTFSYLKPSWLLFLEIIVSVST